MKEDGERLSMSEGAALAETGANISQYILDVRKWL